MEDDDLIEGKGGWLGWVVAALLWAAVGIALHVVLGRA
jgi:hypothetical protein